MSAADRVTVAAVILAIATALGGCSTHTQVGGFTDPDYSGRPFVAPAVYADSPDLVWRKAIEDCTVAQLTKLGVHARASTTLIPPTRPVSIEQRLAILKDHGIDALVVIELVKQGAGWKPWMKTKTRVLDTQTGRVGWVGDTSTGSNAFANLSDVRVSSCVGLATELVKQDVLK